MKKQILAVIAALFGLFLLGCSKHATGPNQALFDYLGDPVAPPAQMDAAYSKPGLTSAMEEAAQAANITLTKIEIEDSEFPFLIGVECAQKGDMQKLKEQIHKLAAYDYGGGTSGDNWMVMNLVPPRAFPPAASQRIFHRTMLREAIFYDKLSGRP
jgi:hypothetical protein